MGLFNKERSRMISVIVPVYNSANYLDKCIQSILNQTYKNFELLLVNDGSIDDSLDICHLYALKDERVKVIDKPNGGVSSARNAGIDNAKGEWITFVDSDDWVHEDFLKKRYELAIAEDADVSYCDVELVYKTHNEYCHSAEINTNEKTQVNSWILSRTTYSPILLVKKELLDTYSLRFPLGIRLCEDFNLILKIIMYAKRTVHVKEALYYYNKQNGGSAMHNLHLYRDDLQIVYSDLIDTFKSVGEYDLYIERISWCILEYKLVSILNKEHSYKDLEDFYPESHRYIWSNAFFDMKFKLFLSLYKLRLGFVADCLLKLYHLRKGISTIPSN